MRLPCSAASRSRSRLSLFTTRRGGVVSLEHKAAAGMASKAANCNISLHRQAADGSAEGVCPTRAVLGLRGAL